MKKSDSEVKKYFSENQDEIISFLKDFVKFKSVSTDSEFKKDSLECADWLLTQFAKIGLKSELIETQTMPLVYAEMVVDQNKPTVLFYGHYDVQPADPYEEWESEPFSPEIRDGRLYGRGACDNKGQVSYFFQALKYLIENDALNCNLKILIEGEEESGCQGILEKLPLISKRLASDVLMVCDMGVVKPNFPTITMGMKGVVSLNFTISGAVSDLHSGIFGGLIKNPALELGKLLASLYNEDGSIAVEGFYDGMEEISKEDLSKMNSTPLSEEEISHMSGTTLDGGEIQYSALERMGWRPNIEINGISSGYTGEGNKSVISNSAKATLSSRLFAGQDPKNVLNSIKTHLERKLPKSMKIKFNSFDAVGGAVMLKSENKYIKVAEKVLGETFNSDVAYCWLGASVPIVASLVELTKNNALLLGFWEPGDAIHAPNESFSIRQLEQGFRSICSILQALGD